MKHLPIALQVVGLVCFTVAAFTFDVVAGLIVAGVCALAAGIQLERERGE